jgi:hypothetical protein
MMRKHLRLLIAVLLAVLLFNSTAALACGPIALEAVFVHTVHPTFPIERFGAGRVGVLQPSYARSYLYVAYRYLNGSGFTPAEQRALTKFWQERLISRYASEDEDWTKAWLEARRKVGSQDLESITVYRSREKPNEYESYLNCQKDAFDTAIATLNERIAKYGVDSPAIKTWIAAQDQVFSNCGGGSVIPEQLPSDTDALLRADRAYQIAAANFYAGNHDEALKGFETIAADNSSPWQRNAVYLIARTLIRKGSLGPAEQKQESLSAAEVQLQKILADKKLSSLQATSTRLLNLVRLRLHPAERLNELARILTAKTENQNLKQDLWDYTTLLDSYLEEDDSGNKPPELPKTEDLTDWIATFQDSSPGVREHALERWQTTHASAWLVASLAALEGKDPKASELIAQARKVPNSSAAFASARFHAIRLLMESGQNAEARTLLDQTLKSERAHFDESSLNLLISRRMLLANSLAEFLTDSARVPAALSWDDDGREVPSNDEETTAEAKTQRGKPLFDVDAAHALNQQLPLSLLKEAVRSDVLPPGPRRDLAQAAWLRAALLSDTTTADELVPVLSKLVPEILELLNNYSSTTPPDEKKFAAIYTWLKAPGLEPVVDAGLGRETPLHQQDSYRDNWWCSSYLQPATDEEEKREMVEFTAPTNAAPPRFLTPSEVERGAKEWSALKALGTAPNYITRQVIQWANSHPTDPRVPEALHLAVKTTRFGCTDKDSSRWSKAAFDLLHRKYPTSPWAKKTPYWFKD